MNDFIETFNNGSFFTAYFSYKQFDEVLKKGNLTLTTGYGKSSVLKRVNRLKIHERPITLF